jgi:hypothetical protein
MATKKPQTKNTSDRADRWTVVLCEHERCGEREIVEARQALRVRVMTYEGPRSRSVWQWLHRSCFGVVSK